MSGKAAFHGRCSAVSKDHPHTRGENDLQAAFVARYYGPSPRTWGTGVHETETHSAHRTIPTHVGRRNESKISHSGFRTIPTHVGSTQELGAFLVSFPGPSPRMWGEQPCSTQRKKLAPDHPHACGENIALPI